jgi:hypothetical protein
MLKYLDKKKCPTHPLTWRRKVGKGLNTTVNEGIVTNILTKKNPPIMSI